MNDLLPYIVIGIASGSVYALAAMGLVLTFQTSGIFNFAHGAQAALGAYVMYELHDVQGWPWPVAFLVSLLLAGVLVGLLLERLAQRLGATSTAFRVAATVGLMLGIQGGLTVAFGRSALKMNYFLPTHVWKIAGVNVRFEQVLVTVFVIVAGLGLHAFMSKTRLGVAMQGVVDDPGLLSLQGTSPTAVRRAAWIIGSCFAATSGMLLAPTIGLDAALLTLLVFQAFGAAAIGRFDRLPLAYLGGLAIGIAGAVMTKLVAGQASLSSLPSTMPFIVLFGVLVLTPPALFVERGGQVVTRMRRARGFDRRTTTVTVVVLATIMLLIPQIVGPRLPLFMTALGFTILFGSLGLLVRTSGQISLCHMTFAAVGAAVFSHVSGWGVPWPLAVLAAGFVAAPVGALVALPAIRLSGVYLAIATFGFGLLVQYLVFPSSFMFSRFTKVLVGPRPDLSWLNMNTDTGYYYVLAAVALLSWFAMAAIRRGRLGRLLRGLADATVALDSHGVNSNITKLLVFCIAAFFAGIAGAVLAPITGSVTAQPFEFFVSLLLVAVLFLAGRQPVLGAMAAAVMYIVIPGYVTDVKLLDYLPVIFGAGAVLVGVVGGAPLLDSLTPTRRTLKRVGRPALPVRTLRRAEVVS